MIWKLIIFFLPFSSFLPSADHAIYITIIEIELNTIDQKGDLIIKSFSDDLANALHNMSSDFSIQGDPSKAPDLILNYITDKFLLKIDDQEVPIQLDSISIEGDTHWISASFRIPRTFSKVEVETKWFTELFLTQQNIVKLKKNDEWRYHRLGQDEIKAEFII